MRNSWYLLAGSIALTAALVGCGSTTDNSYHGELGKLSVLGNGPEALGANTVGATVRIGSIAVSETGEAWTPITEGVVDLDIAVDSSAELVLKDLPTGEYHGIRLDLAPGFHVDFTDGTSVDLDYPDGLAYIQSGIYRQSSTDNGFPETNQYFIFTTLNTALTAPVMVQTDEKSFLVITLEPVNGTALAARAVFTSFMP